MGEDTEARLGVSWAQVAGSALAAVSSAVLLSTLGVAGTVIGAAVGSVAATIGTAVYTRTLDASRQQVAVQAAALRKVTRARRELDEAVAARSRGDAAGDTGITRAGRELDEAEEVLAATGTDAVPGADPDDEPDPSVVGRGERDGRSGRDGNGGRLSQLLAAGWPARLSWRRLAVVAAAVFVVAMGVITAFELTTGQAVSDYTGGSDRNTGSTIPGLGRGGDSRAPTPSESPSPGARSDDPADDGEDPDPAGSALPSEDTTDLPSAEPSETAGTTPSPTLTATPSPSPDLTLTPSSTPTG